MTLKERIARALCIQAKRDPDDTLAREWNAETFAYDHGTTPLWQTFLPPAQAALEAMLDCTGATKDAHEQAMFDAEVAQLEGKADLDHSEVAERMWQAAIKAAIAER